MSEVAQDAHHEFWRPPVSTDQESRQALVDVCEGCGAEFMSGSRYCHACGTSRGTAARPEHWTHYLEFHNIRNGLGLGTASLVAFISGVFCLLCGLIGVALVYSVQTFADFQAVQFYRMEWLLGAVAAFVAGILLKKSPEPKR
ncbi:MAG: hypothetical protein DMG91_05785 [Acidobacteria bacterium]|jgi:hypothetical protein|nr:MAG: hypothetical protein DMG91_05785 [Acidobacteriota bacterium]